MCGIAGRIYFLKRNPAEIRTGLERVEKTLIHRGPDGEGEYYDNFVGALMRRLSIIDIKGGNQPFFSEDRSVVVFANGEIYNYKELRKRLLEKGHTLRSKSDIETIAHLYQEKGINFVEDIRGMFAIFLYDLRRKRVYLIRDRLGEKPIYYCEDKSGVMFASEMKSLLEFPDIKRHINRQAVDNYFHFFFVPEPRTMFREVKKVPAASVLTIDITKKGTSVSKYWEPAANGFIETPSPAKIIRDKFIEACELTLTSDVPVGVTLSGGIDSSAILSVCRKELRKKITAFSVGYSGGVEADETKFARNFAKRLQTDFRRIELNDEEMVDAFPEVIFAADDPVADIASYSVYSVCKKAKESGVSVLLGGIGGDELFWGYPQENHAVNLSVQKLGLVKHSFIRRLHNFVNPDDKPILFNERHKLLSMAMKPLNSVVYFDMKREFIMAEKLLRKMYNPRFKDLLKNQNLSFSYLDFPGGVKDADMLVKSISKRLIDTWLISNCNVLNDRLSMASGVEYRSPFLDFNLVDLALGSREIINSYNLGTKYWFKKAMEKIVPRSVLTRAKRGFTPPVSRWLEKLIERYNPLLIDGFLSSENIIQNKYLQYISDNWQRDRVHHTQFYQLILLEIWGRQYYYGDRSLSQEINI